MDTPLYAALIEKPNKKVEKQRDRERVREREREKKSERRGIEGADRYAARLRVARRVARVCQNRFPIYFRIDTTLSALDFRRDCRLSMIKGIKLI